MTVTQTSDFGWALDQLNAGFKVRRTGWQGPGVYSSPTVWISLQTPTADSKMTLPYLYAGLVSGDEVPWVPSQVDILSLDWTTVMPEVG
jgi:Protein of unknown function (DUF2829)